MTDGGAREDMGDPGDLIDTVRAQYDELTQSQKRIAQTVVDDPEFVAFATVDKFGQRLGVSPSTIVRFAYRVGLDGYQDLQNRVRTLIRTQIRSAAGAGEDAPVAAHLGASVYAASFENDLDHLRRTIHALDVKDLERAVEILSAARRVFVTGDVSSYSVAYLLALVMNRALGKVHLVRADAEGAARLVSIGADDAVVAFTFPPYSRGVLRIVEWAAAHDATTIGITDHAVSPVGRAVTLVLPAVASGVGPANTLVPALAIANALINAVALSGEGGIVPRYQEVNRLLSQWNIYLLGADDDE